MESFLYCFRPNASGCFFMPFMDKKKLGFFFSFSSAPLELVYILTVVIDYPYLHQFLLPLSTKCYIFVHDVDNKISHACHSLLFFFSFLFSSKNDGYIMCNGVAFFILLLLFIPFKLTFYLPFIHSLIYNYLSQLLQIPFLTLFAP